MARQFFWRSTLQSGKNEVKEGNAAERTRPMPTWAGGKEEEEESFGIDFKGLYRVHSPVAPTNDGQATVASLSRRLLRL